MRDIRGVGRVIVLPIAIHEPTSQSIKEPRRNEEIVLRRETLPLSPFPQEFCKVSDCDSARLAQHGIPVEAILGAYLVLFGQF